MIDTSKYKAALDSGDRKAIVAAAREMMGAVGMPLAPYAPNVNANAGEDNSAEKAKLQETFAKQAIGVTRTADAYNREEQAGRGGVEARELAQRVQALETTHGNISEIERIDKGDSFGTGGGFTEKKPEGGSIEDRLIRIEQKLDKLLAK